MLLLLFFPPCLLLLLFFLILFIFIYFYFLFSLKLLKSELYFSHITFFFFSQVYWLGDLNYRITDMDLRLVKENIDQGNYEPLLEYDQLRQQHGVKNVFAGYQEGPITFRPTYKYDPETDNWDSRYVALFLLVLVFPVV